MVRAAHQARWRRAKVTTILLVDDEEPLRRMVEVVLIESGYTVLQASHGQQAVELAREAVPDLIVSDLMMPVLDGIGMCEQLKADATTAHIPVIVMSAGPEPRGIEILVDGYVGKPFELEQFLTVVAGCLAQSRHKREDIGDALEGCTGEHTRKS